MRAKPKHLLLVAHSARMLAQSAVRGGWRPLVMDMFGDEDTRQLAAKCATLKMNGAKVDAAALRAAVARVVREYPDIGLIYGSGLENETGLVADLGYGTTLLANDPSTLACVKNPKRFFALLRQHAIPFPRVRFKAPVDTGKWLRKSASGQGGEGVMLASGISRKRNGYYQRQVKGAVRSVLFLSDRHEAQIIGFNSQWVIKEDLERPFRFSGIINRSDLTEQQRATVSGYVHKIVKAASLCGLNSLDFIKQGNTCLVLEVNPRPSASMVLYDEDFPKGLVDAHVAACQGSWRGSSAASASSTVRAYQIVHASDEIAVPRFVDWPDWCADRPPPETIISRGQPLCSVRASGNEETEVLRKVHSRALSILEWFCGLRQLA